MLLNNMGHDIFWYTELNRDFSSRQRVGEGIPASCSSVETIVRDKEWREGIPASCSTVGK